MAQSRYLLIMGKKKKNYIGFDCGHYRDGIDAEKSKEYGLISDMEYCYAYLDNYPVRTLEYVQSECKKIVDQLEDK